MQLHIAAYINLVAIAQTMDDNYRYEKIKEKLYWSVQKDFTESGLIEGHSDFNLSMSIANLVLEKPLPLHLVRNFEYVQK